MTTRGSSPRPVVGTDLPPQVGLGAVRLTSACAEDPQAASRWRFEMDKKAKTPKKPKQPKTDKKK